MIQAGWNIETQLRYNCYHYPIIMPPVFSWSITKQLLYMSHWFCHEFMLNHYFTELLTYYHIQFMSYIKDETFFVVPILDFVLYKQSHSICKNAESKKLLSRTYTRTYPCVEASIKQTSSHPSKYHMIRKLIIIPIVFILRTTFISSVIYN